MCIKQYRIIDSHNFTDCPVFICMDELRCKENSLILGCYEKETLISIFVLTIKTKLLLRIGQVLYKPFPLNTQEVIDGFVRFISEKNLVDFLLPTPSHTPFEYSPKNSIMCNFGTYILDLKQDEDLLLRNMHQKHRNVIKNVGKKDFFIVENEVETSFQLFRETMLRSKMSYPSYEGLKNDILCHGDSIYCATLWYDNLPQAAVWIKFDNSCAYYIYGGTCSKPLTGAMNYLHWHSILLMKGKGLIEYNFVGARINPEKNSKSEGMQRFKKRFGAKMTKGYMWKVLFNSTKYNAYIYLLKIYSIFHGKKYQPDIIDQELAQNSKT